MAGATTQEEWATRRERGAVSLIRLAVWIVLRIGRPPGKFCCCRSARISSCFRRSRARHRLAYLSRALGRRPTIIDRWRHYRCFATCLIDRVLLLHGRVELFDVTLYGEADITDIRAQGGGCFLFGAHVGSFEVVRAVGRHMAEARTSLVMYEDNARKTNAVLHAINPELAMQIIGLGKPGSMLAVRDRLDEGHLVGLVADRSLESERQMQVPFLGAPARFPVGPFRMAAMLGRPVLLMLGSASRRPALRHRVRDHLCQTCRRADRGDDAALCRAAGALLPDCTIQLVQFLRLLGMMQRARHAADAACRARCPGRACCRLGRSAGAGLAITATDGVDAQRPPRLRDFRGAEVRADAEISRCNLPAA